METKELRSATNRASDAMEGSSDSELARTAEALVRSLHVETLAPRIADSLVEYHANIGCYQCYLFLESHKQENTTVFDIAKLSVRVEFPRVELAYNGHDAEQEVVWWTEIERNVDVSQCLVEDKEDHWYLRLPIRPSDKQPLGGFSSFTQVSPVELRPESYASVTCRGCNAQLLGGEGSTIEKVLPLPSANWMDMFDFWGAGIGAFEHIPRDHIQAQQHRVLVGESYVLLHAADFIAGTTVTDDEDKADVAPGDNAKDEREWVHLTCAECSERVGLCNVEQPDTVRLHKHLIIAHRRLESTANGGSGQEQEEGNVFAKYTIDSILSAKLLEMADSDGIFRFTLISSDDKHDHDLSCGKQDGHHSVTAGDAKTTELQLQLLNWETMIKQQDTSKFRRVLKILYGPRQQMPAIPGLLPSHEVSLPPAMCSAIAQRLRTSSTLLPSSLRKFNRMSVGYLFA